MVSTGIKSSEFPIKHLAKTFYFFYFFIFKAKSKDLADLVKSTKLWVKHQTRINYSHCCTPFFIQLLSVFRQTKHLHIPFCQLRNDIQRQVRNI
jgi:hypothetical protein